MSKQSNPRFRKPRHTALPEEFRRWKSFPERLERLNAKKAMGKLVCENAKAYTHPKTDLRVDVAKTGKARVSYTYTSDQVDVYLRQIERLKDFDDMQRHLVNRLWGDYIRFRSAHYREYPKATEVSAVYAYLRHLMTEDSSLRKQYLHLVTFACGVIVPPEAWFDSLSRNRRWAILQEIFFWVYDYGKKQWWMCIKNHLKMVERALPGEYSDAMARLTARCRLACSHGRYSMGDVIRAFDTLGNPNAQVGLDHMNAALSRIE